MTKNHSLIFFCFKTARASADFSFHSKRALTRNIVLNLTLSQSFNCYILLWKAESEKPCANNQKNKYAKTDKIIFNN